MTEFEKAVQYVRDNISWSDAEEQVALDEIEEYRCPIHMVSDKITCAIHDLMEEYSSDNDLPEGWWYEYGDENDIFDML